MRLFLIGVGVLLFLALIAFLNMAVPQVVQMILRQLP